jgi:ribonuclease Z
MRRIILFAAVCLYSTPVAAQCDSMVVTLLGTGTPNPRVDRLGPSILVEAGRHRLLFDAGRGTAIRLEEAGVRTASVTAVFITHHHSDHTSGIPDVWLTGWLPSFGGRKTPFRLIGPAGTAELARGLSIAFAEDVRFRVAEEKLPREGAQITAAEFHGDTVVFDDGGVQVAAFEVDHGGALRPAYGYRIGCGAHAVVVSGDTRYSGNLVRAAKGADVIVHEVAMAPADIMGEPSVQFILGHHTSPADAARVFEATQPRLAVFTHFAFPPNRVSARRVSSADVLAEARKHYRGRMEAGEDLMRIVIGDSIRVDRRARAH